MAEITVRTLSHMAEPRPGPLTSRVCTTKGEAHARCKLHRTVSRSTVDYRPIRGSDGTCSATSNNPRNNASLACATPKGEYLDDPGDGELRAGREGAGAGHDDGVGSAPP